MSAQGLCTAYKWPNIKEDYPYKVLPVLEEKETGFVLCQSGPIARYLGRKYGLVADTLENEAKCDEYVECYRDIQYEAFTLHGADDKKKEVIKEHIRDVTAAKYLSKIEADFKISGGPYLIGSKITWADLFVAHFGQLLEEFADPSLLQPYPLIKEHQRKKMFEFLFGACLLEHLKFTQEFDVISSLTLTVPYFLPVQYEQKIYRIRKVSIK